jgi:hypothetical protein
MVAPYGFTDSTEVVANYLYTQLGLPANMATFTDAGGTAIQAAWYGDDTQLLPTTPCLSIIPGPENSSYNGVGGRPVLMTFTTFVMVYYAKIQDQQQNVHGALAIANKVKRFVNTDISLGGNVLDCFCSAVDPGVAVRNGALIEAARMTFTSRAKVNLN